MKFKILFISCFFTGLAASAQTTKENNTKLKPDSASTERAARADVYVVDKTLLYTAPEDTVKPEAENPILIKQTCSMKCCTTKPARKVKNTTKQLNKKQ